MWLMLLFSSQDETSLSLEGLSVVAASSIGSSVGCSGRVSDLSFLWTRL